MPSPSKDPGDLSPHNALDFADVKPGERPSASNQNKIHDVLRGNYSKNEYPNDDNGGGATRFCVLLGDMPSGHGSYTWGRFSEWDGTLIEDEKLYNWGNAANPSAGILDGARAGYWMTAELHDDRWRYESGPCPTYCFSEGSFLTESLIAGTVGEPYSANATGLNLDESGFGGDGLPDGLSIDSTGNITGTPTAAGTSIVTITATAAKIGPAPVLPGEKCTITLAIELVINEPEPEE